MWPKPGCSTRNSFPTDHCDNAISKHNTAKRLPSCVFRSDGSWPSGALESRSVGWRARENVVQGGSRIATQMRPASESRISQLNNDSSRKPIPFLISITGPQETFRRPHALLMPPAPQQISITTQQKRSNPKRGPPVHTNKNASLNPLQWFTQRSANKVPETPNILACPPSESASGNECSE